MEIDRQRHELEQAKCDAELLNTKYNSQLANLASSLYIYYEHVSGKKYRIERDMLYVKLNLAAAEICSKGSQSESLLPSSKLESSGNAFLDIIKQKGIYSSFTKIDRAINADI